MVKVIFDISSLQTKLFLVLIIMTLFSILYLAIPQDEFHKINIEKIDDDKNDKDKNKYDQDITYLDIVQYSLSSQLGIQNIILIPKTIRTRILTMIQIFLGYTILLM